MTSIRYTLSRNVDANDASGAPVKIAIAWIVHENGQRQRVAIREDLIQWGGDAEIEREVKRAAAMPADATLLRNDS